MNVLIPLLAGLIIGIPLRGRGSRRVIQGAVNGVVLVLIFLLGVRSGEVNMSLGWATWVSFGIAVLTSVASLTGALAVWRWIG
ncbi:hypothetical protein [Thermococcus sp.]